MGYNIEIDYSKFKIECKSDNAVVNIDDFLKNDIKHLIYTQRFIEIRDIMEKNKIPPKMLSEYLNLKIQLPSSILKHSTNEIIDYILRKAKESYENDNKTRKVVDLTDSEFSQFPKSISENQVEKPNEWEIDQVKKMLSNYKIDMSDEMIKYYLDWFGSYDIAISSILQSKLTSDNRLTPI
ncbi:hypothetical protein TVAG_493220 [Trichomonas vaginalis G3]|uniref:Uncharacterized protein n=1 Tax=Trichomonas vaginalis (strain ATCC PRA-98 / G3) TaxID=412133 RepID=A2F2D0_TRIV3|nr:hypothetical protein TVAGG3_0232950 [Trichomonas vaginalis G3]EAY00949.1 hypothetical protein TVAG_493220 [Trichomonas vaginalis G3]KAI5552783.1 hypothetical protein TVAGG3_0232950 [Trichomonas vaginalis G3]|eukprot:XP_001330034.1 hypothetical protein [Trichomonas vaginalis G3]